MDDLRSHSPAPVGASALPAYVLSAVLTIGLVGALERTDWDAVAHCMHRGYARVYDTLANIHRRARCLAAAVAAVVLLGMASWIMHDGLGVDHICLASLVVVVAWCVLTLPGSAVPRYEDQERRRLVLRVPGRAGYGWMFADETTIDWAEVASHTRGGGQIP